MQFSSLLWKKTSSFLFTWIWSNFSVLVFTIKRKWKILFILVKNIYLNISKSILAWLKNVEGWKNCKIQRETRKHGLLFSLQFVNFMTPANIDMFISNTWITSYKVWELLSLKTNKERACLSYHALPPIVLHPFLWWSFCPLMASAVHNCPDVMLFRLCYYNWRLEFNLMSQTFSYYFNHSVVVLRFKMF